MLLTACGASVAPAVKPILQPPPAGISTDCAAPVDFPPGSLSAGATERLWSQDRAGLLDCGTRHHDAMQFYAGRDKGLAGR